MGKGNIIPVTIDSGYFASCSCGWQVKCLREKRTAIRYLRLHISKCKYTGDELPKQPTNTRYQGTKYDKQLLSDVSVYIQKKNEST